MSDLISVIVPVYKAERYLHACVDSLINQSYKNLEIILVNDGSPDNCPAICQEYAEKDSRIKVINQSNRGQSAARNSGLDAARGDYITFADSDDIVEPYMYEILLMQLKKYHADIAQCGVSRVDGLHYCETDITELNVDSVTLDWKETLIDLLDSGKKFNCALWDKLYRKDMLDGIRFTDVHCGEDFIFLYQILREKQPEIVKNNLPMYHYIYRSESVTTRKLHEKNFSLMDELDKMESAETDPVLREHWKIQKAVSARNILIRQIISGEFTDKVPSLRRNMSRAMFIIANPKYRYIGSSLKCHILLQFVSFPMYRMYIKRKSNKQR